MSQVNEFVNEEWRAVIGYEGWYAVSNRGRVKRTASGQGEMAGRLLTWTLDKNGYPTVPLTKNNRKKQRKIHDLVAAAFIGPRPSSGHEINHINGIKLDPRPNNLEYLTKRENILHAERLGLVSFSRPGESSGNAKLTEEDVRDIRLLYGKVKRKNLAALFDYDANGIWRVATRRAWKHVA